MNVYKFFTVKQATNFKVKMLSN